MAAPDIYPLSLHDALPISPLPSPSASARLRPNSQLRISRQPESRYAFAALFPTAQQFRGKDSFGGIAVKRRDPLTLDLPRLRRNHARRRTAFRRSTPPSLSRSEEHT